MTRNTIIYLLASALFFLLTRTTEDPILFPLQLVGITICATLLGASTLDSEPYPDGLLLSIASTCLAICLALIIPEKMDQLFAIATGTFLLPALLHKL